MIPEGDSVVYELPMSWFRIAGMAAGFLRDAMTSSNESKEPVKASPPPANIAEVTELINRHRFEIDRNFEAVIEMLDAQKAHHLKELQVQRRWNYGLAAALTVISIVAVVVYWVG
jgi:hypothetical protein